METENNKTIELKLSQSEFSDAMVCNDQNLIHKVQMNQILEIVDAQFQKAKNYTPSTTPEDRKIVHNTISIFANRGAGKTTFLLSALKRIRDNYKKNVVCLRPLDPSIIDCKQHPFINIIAAIHQTVEESIKEDPWKKPSVDKDCLEEYKSIYKKLLKGLPFIDGIGNENIYQNWDDELFISMQGMERAEASNNLIDYFHAYVHKALKLLQAVCFVISFDDIDTNFQKGYELLEVIRKYLTTEQIICILTGDLELYGKLVRKASWKCFDSTFLNKERTYAKRNEDEFSTMINHLENQYLLKILKPENRIQLHTINEVIEQDESTIYIYFSDDQKEKWTLDDCYTALLKSLNFPTNNQRVLTSVLLFLKSLSLRSQIRLLYLIKKHISLDNYLENFLNYKYISRSIRLEKNNSIVTEMANIFWNDINQKSSNAKKLITLDPFYTVEMQTFLLHNNLLAGGSNFMPSTNDETLNKALLTIGTIYNIQAKKNSFQIFDFWLRLCYVQYATETFEGGHISQNINDFIEFSCLNDNDDLTKCIGLAQAYCQREYSKYFNMTDKTMAGTMIVDYLPLLQTNDDNIYTSLLLEGTQNEMQNETIFVSIYKLFAAIRDLLFHIETSNITTNISKKQLDNTSLILSKLMQYRSYIEPNNIFNQATLDANQTTENKNFSFGDFYDNDTIHNLVHDILTWQSQYKGMVENQAVSAQLLQRIFTRSYFTMVNIDRSKHYTNVGEKINAYIIGFLNAILVETAIEHNYTVVNLNTGKDIDNIFKNNITSLSKNKNYIFEQLGLYQWMSNCPLLKKFLNPFIVKIIYGYDIDINWKLYQYSTITNNIKIKEKKNQELNHNLKIFEQAIQWLDRALSPSSETNAEDNKKQTDTYINMYMDDNHEKEIIYLDKDMELSELKQNKMELLQKKEKTLINRYHLNADIKNNKYQKKENASFIIEDYKKHENDLSFYNYLCSIEIKESRILNYDSNINKDSL